MTSPLRLFGCFWIVLLAFCGASQAQTITIGALSDSEVCAGATITVPFTTSGTFATGNQFKAQLVSGSSTIDIGVGANPINAIIPSGQAPGSYKVKVVSTSPAKESGDRTLSITSKPGAPTVSNKAYCQGTAAPPLTAGGNSLLWYTTATGGSGSGSAPTPSTSSPGNTSYYVSQAPNGCEGPRAEIVVTVNAKPGPPDVNSVSYCQGATAGALTASGQNLKWYGTNSSGGTGSGAAPTPSTGSPGTVNYYVTQTGANGCESDRAALAVTIKPTPSAPDVSNISYCQNANAGPLTAGGQNLKWYAGASGGTGSGTAPTPPTGTVGSTTFYVSQTINDCEGPRAALTVTVNANAGPPTVSAGPTYCEDAPASPLAATGQNLKWYGTNATGGSASGAAPTPSTNAPGSATYYVSQTINGCESGRAAITVTVNPKTEAPGVSPIAYCQGATAGALTASGQNLKWYGTNSSGGTGSGAAPTPSTGSPGTVNYYVTQTGANGCESNRASLAVTIKPTPSAPSVSPLSLCQSADAGPLTAGGQNLKWYAGASGGTGSGTAPTPPTGTVGSTTFYVSQTINDCEGPRAPLTVTVKDVPPAPTTATTALAYCRNQPSVPVLSATGQNLKWYGTSATGGTASGSAPAPSVSTAGDFNYYVSQTVNGCEGPRAAIPIKIKELPAAPGVADLAYCQKDASKPLTATGNELKWYSVPTGGTAATAAPTPATANPGPLRFYVSQTDNGCEGPRATINVVIKPTPVAPTTQAVSICQNSPGFPLNAGGQNLKWYNSEAGGDGSGSAPSINTGQPGSTTYYVSQSIESCEGPRAALPVTIKPLPASPGVSNRNICQFSAPEPLTAEGQNLKWYYPDNTPTNNTPSTFTENGGAYSYLVTQTVNGCEGPKSELKITILTTPLPTVVSPVIYCRNETAKPLQANGSDLEWTDPNGVKSATTPTPPTLNVTEGASYYVTQMGTNGCRSPKAEVKLIVNAPPTAALTGTATVNLGMPTSLTITFTSVPPFSYTLSDGTSGTSDTQQKVIPVTPKQTTTYQVTSVSNVCGSGLPISPATVTVKIPTITTNALSASTVCAGTAITVPFGTTGEFNSGNTFKIQIADTTAKNFVDISPGAGQGPLTGTIPPNTAQGLYFVRVIATNPSIPVPGSNSPTLLNIRALPTVTLSGARDIYEGESAQLTFTLTGDGPWNFSYSDSAKVTSATATTSPYSVTVTPAKTTTYTVSSVSNNCGAGTVTGTGTAVIKVLPLLGVEPDPLIKAVVVYPVPTEGRLTVDIDLPLLKDPARLELSSFSGQAVQELTTRQRRTVLDIGRQPAGLYLLRIQVGDRSTIRKILKR